MPENDTPFESWAVVEQLGHKRFAGFVHSQTIAGVAFLRVDIPATPEDTRYNTTFPATDEYTKLLGATTIFGITPCTEEVARRAAREIERGNSPLPVAIPAQRQLAAVAVDAPLDEDDDDHGDFGDDEDMDDDHA